MDLARDEMTAYNSRLREQRNRPTIDFNAHVLSASAWPSYPDVEVIIPPVISRAINSFEQFYHTKYSGRRLQWKHSLAHCQLKARFPRGDKEIIVSSFQAIVLLLFNDVPGDETLSYSQIKEITTLSKRPCYVFPPAFVSFTRNHPFFGLKFQASKWYFLTPVLLLF